MPDTTVAGGYRTGEDLLKTVIREAEEEASVPASLLVQPEVEYVYDMEAPEGPVPRSNDDEVEWFQVWDTDKIKDGLAQGLFKPIYALILLDFFVRHGVLDTMSESYYAEIVARLRRTLEYPTRPVK